MFDAKPTVFVVDDDASVRESLKLLIESAGWQPETFGSAQEFLSRPRVHGPSCLVLDVVLPDINGCDLQKLIADRADMPIIFVTGHADVPTTVRAMKAGAVEFLTKPFVADVLLDAIQHAIEESGVALDQEAQMEGLRERYGSLTHRERQVMGLVVSGHLNKQVGAELGISEITVKAHRSKMTRKMKARTVADLVHMADKLRIAPARRADAQRPGSNSSQGEGSSGSCDTGTGAVARGTAAHAHGGHPAIAGSRRPAGEIRTDRYGG